MDEASVDAIVTDPPYGLASGPTSFLEDATSGRGFMGKEWDRGVPGPAFWREALRVAKPGAYLLAFGGTRAFHRMAVAIEDAGWEIRDCVCWLYGQGFPKSLNMESEWAGWGTALKPAWEPIIMARKPLEGTVAANLLKHGTGALNIDGARVGAEPTVRRNTAEMGYHGGNLSASYATGSPQGRWPANLMHDGSDEVVAGFPNAGGGNGLPIHAGAFGQHGRYGKATGATTQSYADSGSASRFFYCAKASRADREEGCEQLPTRSGAEATDRQEGTAGLNSPRAGASRTAEAVRNHHPTVKPTELMRYLIRLITPPGGTVLDPFMGSGSTGKAAMLEGATFRGCDLDPAYLTIAEARILFGLQLEAEEAAEAYESTRQLSLFGDL